MNDRIHGQQPNDNPENKPSKVGNIIAIIIFIAIVAVGLWGLINAFRLLPNMFPGLFDRSPRAAELSISIPSETIDSETPVTVSWTHDTQDDGSYSIAHPCQEDFTLRLVDPEETIPCDVAYPLEDVDTRSVRVIPTFTRSTTVEVPISILYTNEEGDRTATETEVLTVAGERLVTGPTTPTTTPTTPTSPSTPTTPQPPAGPPDLATHVLQVGVIDPYTGSFIAKDHIYAHETAAVRFEVRNIGSARSGTWQFSAYLPTDPPHTYHSPRQQALGIGDWIEYTLTFDQLLTNTQTIRITADPANEVRESNTHNNTATRQITIIK